MKKSLFPLLFTSILAGGFFCACSDNSDDSSKECSAAETKCENNTYYTCDNDKWKEEKQCTAGCNTDKTACEVESGLTDCDREEERTCDGNYVSICTGGKWMKAEYECVDGCDKGACKMAGDHEMLESGAPCSVSDLRYCGDGVLLLCKGSVLIPVFEEKGKVKTCAELDPSQNISCVGDTTGSGNGKSSCIITCADGSQIDYEENKKCPE